MPLPPSNHSRQTGTAFSQPAVITNSQQPPAYHPQGNKDTRVSLLNTNKYISYIHRL